MYYAIASYTLAWLNGRLNFELIQRFYAFWFKGTLCFQEFYIEVQDLRVEGWLQLWIQKDKSHICVTIK